MENFPPAVKNAIRVEYYTGYRDRYHESNDVSLLRQEVIGLEEKLVDDCADPSLKLQALQRGAGNYVERDRNHSLDENRQTDEERCQHDSITSHRSGKIKRHVVNERYNQTSKSVEPLVGRIQLSKATQRTDEPQDTTRKHGLHKENVRLANLLTMMAGTLGESIKPQKMQHIERLCQMVHSKEYNINNDDSDT